MIPVSNFAKNIVFSDNSMGKSIRPILTEDKVARQQEIIQNLYGFKHGGSKKNIKKRKRGK